MLPYYAKCTRKSFIQCVYFRNVCNILLLKLLNYKLLEYQS